MRFDRRSFDLTFCKTRFASKPVRRGRKPSAETKEAGMSDAATITTQDDYQHVKTGGIYTVISTATMEATGELVVVYRRSDKRANNPASEGTWVRPMSEFSDGRFVKLKYRRACGCDIDETCICDDPDFN